MNNSVRSISFIAMICALNCVFLLISNYLPFASLILTIGIPIITCLSSMRLSYRYNALYIFATCLISLIDFQNAIFYIFPGVIAGTIFGVMIKNACHSLHIVIISSIISLILYVLANYIIDFLYQVNMMELFAIFLNIPFDTFKKISLAFFYIIALAQTLFTLIILNGETKRLKVTINQELTIMHSSLWMLIGSIIGTIICYFIYYPLALVFLIISIMMSISVIAHLTLKNDKSKQMIILFVILFVGVIITSLIVFNNLSKEQLALLPLLYTFVPFLVGIISIIINKNKHHKFR